MERIGRYKIVRELGRGAMGVVYHAIDPNIGRPVAIKTIQLSARKPEEQERLRERLFREARSAGILSHPGIVTIYDVEQQGDLAYIAMEYVDGPTLDQLLSSPQGISSERMFSILGQTAVALDYAHQKGIIHRDIKPANLMIAGDGTTKITDFGIAKVTTSEQFTMTGAIVGTPHYMSPEQVQGQPVDGRSDQFSLAVIAFEMLTGEKPYTGEHLTTVVYKIVAEEPVPPNRLNPSLGGAIEAVMKKALSKKADARYHNCQEFTSALEEACNATKGWKTMPRGGSLNEPTIAEVNRSSVSIPPPRRRERASATTERAAERKSGFLTFLLAILMAAGLLALIGWQAAPWIMSNQAARNAEKAAAKAASQAPAQPQPQVTSPPPTTAPATGPATVPDAKPSPMSPPLAEAPHNPPVAPQQADEPAPKTPAKQDQPVRRSAMARPSAAAAQPVEIISSPGGATATMDGRADSACNTPCSIDAAPGRHTVAISMPGYQTESRQVDVGSNPVEMDAIVLRAPAGTLMLTSVPAGATVLVNGKRVPGTTPTQIPLAPGSYKVTVQKDGIESTQTVEVHGGISYLKVLLGQ